MTEWRKEKHVRCQVPLVFVEAYRMSLKWLVRQLGAAETFAFMDGQEQTESGESNHCVVIMMMMEGPVAYGRGSLGSS